MIWAKSKVTDALAPDKANAASADTSAVSFDIKLTFPVTLAMRLAVSDRDGGEYI